MTADSKKTRDDVLRRWSALKQERQGFMPLWEELADVLMPKAGRFNKKRRDRQLRDKYKRILDNTALRAINVLAAGMQAGMASPARRWFSLESMNPSYMQSQNSRLWFDYVADNMFMMLGRSNIYQALHAIYQEMGVFGVGVAIVVPDFYTVIRAHSLTVGEYALAQDANGEVDTLYREFDMTVGQMVEAFGLENVSSTIKHLYEKNNLDEWVTILHAIEPRRERDASKKDNTNMPWRSVYLEPDGGEGKILSESGFPIFPVLAARWDVTSNDVYGDSPGMQAIGDVRHLFFNQKRKAQGMDQQYNPSLQVPFGLNAINTLPGGITRVDGMSAQVGVRRMYEVSTDMSGILEDIHDVRNRINSAFFVDMFLMISQRIDRTMTATEVASLNEEKLMMIGPTYERMQYELYRRLIDIMFFYMSDAGLVPPPPDELQGMPMRVEFTSMMAQAMKASQVNTVDRFLACVFNVAQVKQEVLDKIDADRLVDSYAEMLSVPPELIADEKTVRAIREQRAQAQAAQQAQIEAQQQASMAKELSQADISGDNALTQLMDQYQGY
ncbi:MAG: portal protein [Oxalobacter formigenes]|nr:portal protein [Oxalobacter formigenes]